MWRKTKGGQTWNTCCPMDDEMSSFAIYAEGKSSNVTEGLIENEQTIFRKTSGNATIQIF